MESNTKEALAGASIIIAILLVGAVLGGIAGAIGTYYVLNKEETPTRCEYIVDIHGNPRHICR